VGQGIRGDLKATLAAVLLDPETISEENKASNTFGKVREPYIRFINWARAFSVKEPNMKEILLSGRGDDGIAKEFKQSPFEAPSVFNFFKVHYIPPQTTDLGKQKLLAPEMSLLDVNSVYDYIHLLNRYIYEYSPQPYKDKNGVVKKAIQPNYTYELTLIKTPKKLVEHLNLVLASNELNQESKDKMISVLNEITILDEGKKNTQISKNMRVYVAISMMMNSPEYLIQR
jgi:hypothetical protein